MQALSRKQMLALVLLTLFWGVNWPMMKLSLAELQPLHFRALTMSLGTVCLAAFFRWRGARLWPNSKQEWQAIVMLALPNVLGWHGLSIYGVQQLPSGRAAILGFTMPVWTVLLGVVFYGQKLTPRLLVAIAAVLAAIGLLLANELGRLAGSPSGILWMQAAAFCWALGTIWTRQTGNRVGTETLIVWMMAIGSVAMALLAWNLEPAQSYHFSAPVWISLVYGVLINYGVAQILWFSLARVLPPSTSAISVMAIPLIGTLSATFIVGERPHWQDYAAMVFVMLAIASVLLPVRRPST